MPRKSTPLDFWQKVDRSNLSGCWVWTGAKDDHGYGRVRYHQREWATHRLAWRFTHSDPANANVLHHCDNPPCCNPSHLFLGTQTDNMADCAAKGRHPKNSTGYLPTGDQHHGKTRPEVMARGEANGAAVLTEEQVKAIRRKRTEGATLQSLAGEFGVAKGTINFIVQRKTWTHIQEGGNDSG